MITVDFGGDEKRSNQEITTKWLNQAFHNRLVDTNLICVNIHIDKGEVQLSLPCGACPRGGKSVEEFNREARYLIEIWRKHGLNKETFAFGKLESFLKRLFNHFDIKFK